MSGAFAFDWHGLRLEARPSGALHWPEGGWLIVADLHFGKSERMARRGGALLPPYEGLATIERLQDEVAATDPRVIVSLGDGFDDDAAAAALDDPLCAALSGLMAGRRWWWVAGNHDPSAPCPRIGGDAAAELQLGAVTLRHAAMAGTGPDISGHYHPAVRLAGRRTRAFLIGQAHLILPAFGAYTGGMDATEPALARLTSGGMAVACLHKALPMPLRRAAG